MGPFLAVLRSFFHSALLYNFTCHHSPPTILPSYLTLSCHLFLGLTLNLYVSKFIYDTLLGILFPSILCTSPNQHNFISFNSLYIPKQTQFYFLQFSVHPQTNTIPFPSILCASPSQHNSISFHSLYISKSTQFCFLQFSVNSQTNTILFPSILCTSQNQHNSISFHSLYISKPT
jgi:hypothetical protein